MNACRYKLLLGQQKGGNTIGGPVYPNSSTPASVRNTAAVLFAPFSLRAHPEPVLANRRVFKLEKQPKKNRSVFVSLQDGQTGKETIFFSHLYIKTIFKPRQARNKRRETSKQRRVFLGGADLDCGAAGCLFNIIQVRNAALCSFSHLPDDKS